ncbi:hypothetical protein NSP_40950 [Nodularia spumigena CCY9414]|jgi:hypothetical protein|nr:hypothetical protein NSP_40950 [Nodularia spumigena CCY9414]
MPPSKNLETAYHDATKHSYLSVQINPNMVYIIWKLRIIV